MFRLTLRGLAFALALFCVSPAAHAACCTTTIDSGSATDSNFSGGVAFTEIPLTPPGTNVTDLTLRYGTNFSYSIPVDNVPYVVTFHFLETTVAGPFQRTFSVSINNQPALQNFDMFAECGYMQPCSRSVIAVGADQVLNIVFTASVRNAMVSSIDFTPLFQIFATQAAAPAFAVINAKCTRCHGNDVIPGDTHLVGGLDLRTLPAILQGGSRGPAVIRGQSRASPLYLFASFVPSVPPSGRDVLYANGHTPPGILQMPPYEPLQPEEIAALKLWIDLGAVAPQ
jgi:hypothetical protein